MNTIDVTKVGVSLVRLTNEVLQSRAPLRIASEEGSVVVLPEEDWRSMEETIHLLSIPGMLESIREGLQESVEECSENPGW